MRTKLVGFTLFFIILTPLFISLFLHNFGNNRFDIPIYHEKYIPDEFSFCSIKITSPYLVASDSILKIGNNLIIMDVRLYDAKDVFINNQIQRLLNNNFLLNIYTISSYKLDLKWDSFNFKISDLNNYVACKFLYEINFSSLILIDKFGSIRGYYNSNSEDEFERLSAEIKILNKI